MCYYIPPFNMDEITYPWSNSDADLANFSDLAKFCQ